MERKASARPDFPGSPGDPANILLAGHSPVAAPSCLERDAFSHVWRQWLLLPQNKEEVKNGYEAGAHETPILQMGTPRLRDVEDLQREMEF